ncbi:MAG: hypothetical protein EOO28_11470 [Comamonadaceae bacterium]|nr:MAG: hypothetical protein EOO28_11470 [Comamonadaceae bacterium]
MTNFARTPGNSRHDVLRHLVASPRQRVQRIMQVTRACWWPVQPEQTRPEQRFGPGHRPLKLSHQN